MTDLFAGICLFRATFLVTRPLSGVLQAVAVAGGFEDVAVVCEPILFRGRRLCVLYRLCGSTFRSNSSEIHATHDGKSPASIGTCRSSEFFYLTGNNESLRGSIPSLALWSIIRHPFGFT